MENEWEIVIRRSVLIPETHLHGVADNEIIRVQSWHVQI